MAATLAGDGRKVGAVAEKDSDEFDGAARVFSRDAGAVVPFGEKFGAALDAQAVADVVTENDVESRDDAVGDQFGKGMQIILIGGGKEVVRVAGDDELVPGVAVVEVDNAIDP